MTKRMCAGPAMFCGTCPVVGKIRRDKGIFAIANNWREARPYPMRRLRFELFSQMRRLKQEAPAPVARLKHMRSIRERLRTTALQLDQIPDFAACRAYSRLYQGRAIIGGSMQEHEPQPLCHNFNRPGDMGGLFMTDP
jgi:hypothetical protein